MQREASPTTHCLCLFSGLLVLWPSSPWPPITREKSRRKEREIKTVRPIPHSQNTGSFSSFWLDVFDSHHFYFCDRELQLRRFVSVGHHYKCTSIANYFWYTCALNNQTAKHSGGHQGKSRFWLLKSGTFQSQSRKNLEQKVRSK